jgi:hypothetical protein
MWLVGRVSDQCFVLSPTQTGCQGGFPCKRCFKVRACTASGAFWLPGPHALSPSLPRALVTASHTQKCIQCEFPNAGVSCCLERAVSSHDPRQIAMAFVGALRGFSISEAGKASLLRYM